MDRGESKKKERRERTLLDQGKRGEGKQGRGEDTKFLKKLKTEGEAKEELHEGNEGCERDDDEDDDEDEDDDDDDEEDEDDESQEGGQKWDERKGGDEADDGKVGVFDF